MAQASYFDTARRPVSFLAKKARFVTTSNLRSCHKAGERIEKDRHRSYGFWALQVESFQMLISRRTSMDVFVCVTQMNP